MKVRVLAAAAALALTTGSAMAGDQTIDISSGVGSFIGTAPLFDGGDDLITFTGVSPGIYNFILTFSGHGFNLDAADLNGVAGVPIAVGQYRFLGIDGMSPPDFYLTLKGSAVASNAAYSGELTISLIPEPGTYAMFAAGLAALGLVARRRSKA